MQTHAPCPRTCRAASQGAIWRTLPQHRSRAVAVHALDRNSRNLLTAGLGCVVGLSLLLTGAPSSDSASSLVEEAIESEETIEMQSKQLEYILQQQNLVKKAQIEAQRQQLSLQKTSVENAIQQKLTEQRASALSAKAKGDEARLRESEAEAAELEAAAQKVQAAAAKVEARLSRAEMLEKARTVAGQQIIRKAVSDAEYNINLSIDKQLEAGLAKK